MELPHCSSGSTATCPWELKPQPAASGSCAAWGDSVGTSPSFYPQGTTQIWHFKPYFLIFLSCKVLLMTNITQRVLVYNMSENGALSLLYTISFFTCHGFWVGYTMINKVCFVPDRLHIPYHMFKFAASTNQSKQPSLPCEMMKNINYVVFKQMVKSFLIRLQGPVCVYAHCKILVIPGSVGLYNVPHRFN